MSELHARAFAPARGWSALEFESFLQDPACAFAFHDHGFALGRVTLDEAELLTIATDTAHQRAGFGRELLTGLCREVKSRGADFIFLEVATDNRAALALYSGAGFQEVGRRKAYYPRDNGPAADALVLRLALK